MRLLSMTLKTMWSSAHARNRSAALFVLISQRYSLVLIWTRPFEVKTLGPRIQKTTSPNRVQSKLTTTL